MNIDIENQTKERFDFRGYKKLITEVIETVATDKDLPKDLTVDVFITEPETIKEINNEERGIDKATDVLSFPYFEFEKPGVLDKKIDIRFTPVFGDIIICAKKVIDQAKEYGHSQKRELAYLTLHSMLHLVGYDHINKKDEDVMNKEAERFMGLLNITR